MKRAALTIAAIVWAWGCDTPGPTQLIIALQAVSDTAAVVAAALAVPGLDPDVKRQVRPYVQGIAQAAELAIVELESERPAPEKIERISAAFLQVAAPALESAPEIQLLVDAIATAVRVFLGRLHDSSAMMRQGATRPTIRRLALSPGDREAIRRMRADLALTIQITR